jgi:hypothetical protein
MNRIILLCGVLTLVVFGGLFLVRKNDIRVIPYYVQGVSNSLLSAPPTIPHFDPPTVDQIKKDISGKSVTTGSGNTHQFAGPEINTILIQKVTPVDHNNVAVEVTLCADTTIVEKTGVLRRHYTHEKVCGTLRVYYERKGEKWSYRMSEDVDLQKTLTPNAKAPSQVFRFR